ncbi:MAG: BlaI/MecI/CopY family transcriptional regulator [Bacteroidota bacterium]
MKQLTKAEEPIMQVLWKLKKAFLKDIVEEMPEPKPAYPTVSTVIRVLVNKGFVDYKTYGKANEYYPVVSKQDYFKTQFKGMVNNFFGSSWKGFASFFAKDAELSLQDLEAIRAEIEKEIEEKKKSDGDAD